MIGSIEVNLKESIHHIEVNVSDLKGYEKNIIIELMKETQSKISPGSQSPDNDCRGIYWLRFYAIRKDNIVNWFSLQQSYYARRKSYPRMPYYT